MVSPALTGLLWRFCDHVRVTTKVISFVRCRRPGESGRDHSLKQSGINYIRLNNEEEVNVDVDKGP